MWWFVTSFRHVPVTLTDVVQVPFIESTIMPVIRAERKIAELEPKAANTQPTIHCAETLNKR